MLLIHKEIKDFQLYNYNYLMTKKRAQEYASEEKNRKKRRKEEAETRREEAEKQAKRIRHMKGSFSLVELLNVESEERRFDEEDLS